MTNNEQRTTETQHRSDTCVNIFIGFSEIR